MSSGKLQVHTPANHSSVLWKYLDLHRFIYLITQEKFFFSRLDRFEDPFEGIATRLIRQESHFSEIRGKYKKRHDLVHFQEAVSAQKSQYVNCWFAGERESMAMWNLHSEPDSVALKADFKTLSDALRKPFREFIKNNEGNYSVICSSVHYLELNPFNEKAPAGKYHYSALKKDKSFEYEKEYRFLIVAHNLTRSKAFISIPVDLEQLDLTVISHPNIEDWEFRNLERLIELSGKKIRLQRSPIILRKD
jgi:hypothetical protein